MKKGMLSAMAIAALMTGLLIGVSSSSADAPAGHEPAKKAPTPSSGPAYRHYVACGLSRKAKPAHSCPEGSKKGAFFKSLKADVKYTVCVKFPKREHLCTEKPQEAEQGTLYVNKITSTTPGRHEVTWFVKGKKVGTTVFRVK
jgi:hypothetical protein